MVETYKWQAIWPLGYDRVPVGMAAKGNPYYRYSALVTDDLEVAPSSEWPPYWQTRLVVQPRPGRLEETVFG